MNCRDKVFNIIECGENVIDMIFKLLDGDIFIPAFIVIPNYIDNNVNLIGNSSRVITLDELEEEVRKIYVDE